MFEVSEIPANTDSERYCPECCTMKPFELFYKDGHDSDGNVKYRRDCKDCYKAKRAAAAAAKKAKRKAEAIKAAKAEAARAKAKGRRK